MSTGSLTPSSRSQEATSEAAWEGYVNGALTLLPSLGALYIAMQNPRFMRATNVQSRTAMAIMPALFVFGYSSEKKLTHKMHTIAEETRHTSQTVEWAERQHVLQNQNQGKNSSLKQFGLSDKDKDAQLTQLYRQSVMDSGVRIVPGDALTFPHVLANYTATNPIKVLAAVAVPSVAWIFYGRTGKQHLDFSVKLLHTRVFGQFATISLLLSVMGFKEYMDQQGKFITQADVDARVEDMKRVRQELMDRLEIEHQHELANKQEIVKAHEQDVEEKRVKNKHHHQPVMNA